MAVVVRGVCAPVLLLHYLSVTLLSCSLFLHFTNDDLLCLLAFITRACPTAKCCVEKQKVFFIEVEWLHLVRKLSEENEEHP